MAEKDQSALYKKNKLFDP